MLKTFNVEWLPMTAEEFGRIVNMRLHSTPWLVVDEERLCGIDLLMVDHLIARADLTAQAQASVGDRDVHRLHPRDHQTPSRLFERHAALLADIVSIRRWPSRAVSRRLNARIRRGRADNQSAITASPSLR